MRDRPALPLLRAALVAILVVASARARAQESQAVNEYTLGWTDPHAHLYDVTLAFQPSAGDSADVHLPIWRPGRYVRQNYAANVQEFSARSAGGEALGFRKSGISTWRISTAGLRGGERVSVRYRYYANTLDAGASLLSPEEAYFNPVNLLMFPEGQIARPVRLTIAPPKGWRTATALARGGRGNVLTAPDYHTLADSPTIVSPSLQALEFTVDEVPYTIWLQGRFEPGERRESIARDVERIIRRQTAIFGGAPFDEYAFLFHLVPYPFGHAVEHASSASFVIQDNAFESETAYGGFLDIVAHELFHAWNVKRIRPAALWPYDYMREQLTTLHWFTEGVTSYYAGLTVRRAGLTTPETFLREMGGVIDGLQRTPGRRIVPVSLSSWDSWLTGYGQGNPNLRVDFYGKGQVLGFLLDAMIRERTDGARSLDDVFATLWETYLGGRGVPEDGVQAAAERVAGGSLQEFFTRYVSGTEELPYDEVLRPFGVRVSRVPDPARPEATLRIQTRPEAEGPVVVAIDPESPALAGGLDTGDALLAVDGRAAPASGWEGLLADVQPGDTVRLTVRRRDRIFDLDSKVAGEGNVRWALERVEEPDARQERLFDAWLGEGAETPEG
ncbi:MAG: M61 family metallopeptidase [Gemmatimonadetes bacterium]|nr:M61 family metallopeptidase [Gemmatimonadota bacterium]